MEELRDLREDYGKSSLDEKDMLPQPTQQLEQWLAAAKAAGIGDINAMVLSTVDSLGQPSSRVVLLRQLTEQGLGFFTNYNSQKAIELEHNPQASLIFFWRSMQRQVRVQGLVEKMSESESDAYFDSRPRSSQIGAWSSPQSAPIPSRESLESVIEQYDEKFKDRKVSRPSFWGGFRLTPTKFEFWQGRPSRLHDRVVYHRGIGPDDWRLERVAP